MQPFEINYKSNRVFMPYDQKYKIGDGFNVYFLNKFKLFVRFKMPNQRDLLFICQLFCKVHQKVWKARMALLKRKLQLLNLN